MQPIGISLILLIVCLSILLYTQKIKINLPYLSSAENKSENIKPAKAPIQWQKLFSKLLSFAFWILLMSFVFSFGKTLLAFVKDSVWTSPYGPVARFIVKVDWENKEVKLDASMSKSYKNNFKKLIWRIDDGEAYTGTQVAHKFKYPGYYTIKLSVIDSFDQSDQAICNLNIPPKQVQKVVYKGTVEGTEEGSKVSSVEKIKYLPAETYFNYSKRYTDNDSASDLESPFISTDCGLSDRPYNTSNTDISWRLKSLLDVVLFHATLLIFIIVLKKRIGHKNGTGTSS